MPDDATAFIQHRVDLGDETLRDLFAATALSGMTADRALGNMVSLNALAELAYEVADAMIEARAKNAAKRAKNIPTSSPAL